MKWLRVRVCARAVRACVGWVGGAFSRNFLEETNFHIPLAVAETTFVSDASRFILEPAGVAASLGAAPLLPCPRGESSGNPRNPKLEVSSLTLNRWMSLDRWDGLKGDWNG